MAMWADRASKAARAKDSEKRNVSGFEKVSVGWVVMGTFLLR
jgi:hypothetical protein